MHINSESLFTIFTYVKIHYIQNIYYLSPIPNYDNNTISPFRIWNTVTDTNEVTFMVYGYKQNYRPNIFTARSVA